MADTSEEAAHFEQVLGRLDALLKRNQAEATPPVNKETSDNNIPVLTEVYKRQELTEPVAANIPVLTNITTQPSSDIKSDQSQAQESAPERSGDKPESPAQPLAATNQEYLIEKVVAAILPSLQSRISEIVKDQTAEALHHLQTGVIERLQSDIRQIIESELNNLLKATAPESQASPEDHTEI